MSYQHLSTYERGCIETLYKLGYSNRKIALELGRHHSTIDRELTRNDAKTKYHAPKAYEAYTIRRKNSKPKGKYWTTVNNLDTKMKTFIYFQQNK